MYATDILDFNETPSTAGAQGHEQFVLKTLSASEEMNMDDSTWTTPKASIIFALALPTDIHSCFGLQWYVLAYFYMTTNEFI